ncbi:granzyme H-like [Rhynchonycteris naso]
MVQGIVFFGKKNGKPPGKIIGEHEAKPHSHPYMTYVHIQRDMEYRCGGVLVQKNFVLIAAHCSGRSIMVILWAHKVRKKERTQKIIPVKTAIHHPNNHPKVNDIMLLQLQTKAILTATVGTLGPPGRGATVKPEMVCRVAGWGRLNQNTNTDTLHEVELEIQKDVLCISRYKSPYNRCKQICVGDPENNQSAFKGDSGGPLVCDDMAQGIVSFGKKNGKPPGIETRISSFLPWIKRTMRHFQLQRPF